MASKISYLVAVFDFCAQITFALSAQETAQKRYTYGASSVTIPFHDVADPDDFGFDADPTIAYRIVTGGQDSSRLFTPDLDTGSTSVVVGAGHWPNWKQNKDQIARDYPQGYEYLSSSEILYFGYWVNSTIRFEDTAVDLTADFPILVVNESIYCSNYSNTSPGECPLQNRTPRCNDTAPCTTNYFGIGFGREADGQEQSTPDKNALLNIQTINNQSLPSDYSVGYTITGRGVTVGLTQDNTDGYEMIQLLPQSDLQYDWQMVKGCLQITPPNQTVPNECVGSNILLDTGITAGFLRLTSESGITTGWKNSSKGGLYQSIPEGYNVTTIFGENQWQYSFISGEGSLAPTSLTANYYGDPGDVGFINTGIHFYKVNTIVFDAVNGLWGVKARSENQQNSSTSAISAKTATTNRGVSPTTFSTALNSSSNESAPLVAVTLHSGDATTFARATLSAIPSIVPGTSSPAASDKTPQLDSFSGGASVAKGSHAAGTINNGPLESTSPGSAQLGSGSAASSPSTNNLPGINIPQDVPPASVTDVKQPETGPSAGDGDAQGQVSHHDC